MMLSRLFATVNQRLHVGSSLQRWGSALGRHYTATTPLLAEPPSSPPPAFSDKNIETRAKYKKSLKGMEDIYREIPEEQHEVFRQNHPVTNKVTDHFSQSRRSIGEHYKDETAVQSEQDIREIKKRNLQLYRNELGPTTDFLRNGPTEALDKAATEKLVQEYGMREEDIRLVPMDKEKLKNNLDIIQSSFKMGGKNLNLQDPAFLDRVAKAEEQVKTLPEEVQTMLHDLQAGVHTLVHSREMREAVADLEKVRNIGNSAGIMQPVDVTSAKGPSPVPGNAKGTGGPQR